MRQARCWLGGMETDEQQIFGLGLTAGVILAIHNYGWDIHVWDLPPEDNISSRKVRAVNSMAPPLVFDID